MNNKLNNSFNINRELRKRSIYLIGIALFSLIILALLGMPIALAILASTLIFYLTNDAAPTINVYQGLITGIQSFPLLSIPFFILVGELMNASKMTGRLLRLADSIFGHLKGGIAYVNVATNTLMAGLSGSSNADAAVLSKTLVPEMVKDGYSKSWSSALTASGAIIGSIIPPSIALIIFGYLANVSIASLFLGGIIPGIMISISLMVTVYIISKRNNLPRTRGKMSSFKEVGSAFLGAIWAIFLPVLIVGGIRFGVFTHTEAAAIAVFYCLIVGFFIHRSMKIKDVINAFVSTVKLTSIIMLIVAAANGFGRMLSWERIPQTIAEWIASSSTSPIVLLLIINIILLILGSFSEGVANLIILTPLLMPVALEMGFDPVAFGVMMVFNLTIGLITPPLGTVMYTVCAINNISTTEYTKRIWPFLIASIVVLFIITYVPITVTFLPNLLME